MTVPHQVRVWHSAIDRLLKEDEERRQKQPASVYTYSWDKPRFDSPFERRRLRILNSLFLAAVKMNGKPSISTREGLHVGSSFHQQFVHITLDQPKQSNHRGQVANAPSGSSETKLSLSILHGSNSETARMTWQDGDDGKLETHITEIAIQLVLSSEIQYRERAVHQYQWRVERRARLEEEELQRKLAAERAEKE